MRKHRGGLRSTPKKSTPPFFAFILTGGLKAKTNRSGPKQGPNGFRLKGTNQSTDSSMSVLSPNGFRLKGTNQSGQGLIEYLILVALMSVASIGILRTLNQTVKSRFANAIYALQGKTQKAKTHNLRKEEYQRSDLSNFMSGAASSDKKKSRSGRRAGRP